MEAFLVSTGIVALAKMGDKAQLLALVLAARYRKSWPIVLGVLVATLLANAPVVWFGERITRRVPIRTVHLVSATIFAALGVTAILNGPG